MNQPSFVILLLWMTVSRLYQSDCFLLTSANSLLAKFIKVPPSSSSSAPSELIRPNSKVASSSVDKARRYRIEIPIYEPIATDLSWDSSKNNLASSPVTGYRYWTYSKVPRYEMPVFDYQSVSWPSSVMNSITDHLPSSLLEEQHWTPSPVTAPRTASSYQYPLYLPSPSSTKTPTSSTSASLYLIGKSKDFLIPSPNSKTKAGQLPLSLIALNSGPQEMLTVSEDKRYEIRHGPGKYNNHFYDDQKTFFHQQTDHVDSSNDPYSETRTYEHFQHEKSPQSDENHYFNQHSHNQMPSIIEQYPYYMEDSYDNFASLLDRSPQKEHHKPQAAPNSNWPHQSKYEPINQRNAIKPIKTYSLGKADNCTQKNLPYKILKNGDQTPFQPVASHSEFFESIRKRSGSTEKTSSLPLNAPSLTQQQKQMQDNLITANSVKRQTKIKMNKLDQKHDNNEEEDENVSEYDKHKSGQQERALNSEDNYESKNELADSTGDGPKDEYEKERVQWLKDKGYAKHGWKNVYHKEEWGEAKKYHDVWRFKDWKDRYNEKVGASSNLIPIAITPSIHNNASTTNTSENNRPSKAILHKSNVNDWIPIV